MSASMLKFCDYFIDKKIFISHGVYDNVISVNEGREANKILKGIGFKVEYKEYPITHEISLDVISDIKKWIEKTHRKNISCKSIKVLG